MNLKFFKTAPIFLLLAFISSCDLFNNDDEDIVPEEQTTFEVGFVRIDYLDWGVLESYTFYNLEGNSVGSYSLGTEEKWTIELEWKGREIDISKAHTGINGAGFSKPIGDPVDSVFVYEINPETQERKFKNLLLIIPTEKVNSGYSFYIENFARSGYSLEDLKERVEGMATRKFRKTFPD